MIVDGEQFRNTASKIGRGLAAAGLFISGCAPSADILSRTPEVSLKTYGYHIEREANMTLRVTGEGAFYWQYNAYRNAGVDYLRKVCNVAVVLNTGEARTVNVVVTDMNCFPKAP